MSDRYRYSGGEERIQRVGSGHSTQVLILEPLFEEKNRTRRLIAQIMQLLDNRGIGTALPDLPGTGESFVNSDTLKFSDWLLSAQAATQSLRPTAIISFRAGSLLDGVISAAPRWRFAPETGARAVRDLERMRLTAVNDPNLYGGHRLRPEFVEQLRAATLSSGFLCRTVRLETDAMKADHKVIGTPLWRRAEPGEDAALAQALTNDLEHWIRTCAAF